MTAQQRRFDKILAVLRPILVVVLGLALIALVVVGLRIQSALVELRTDAKDNLNWNVSQIEVDLVRLVDEIRYVSVEKTAPLAELRKRYDLFYSRSQNAINGDGYSAPGFETQSKRLAALLQDFLLRETDLIDGDDAALRAALPDMADRADKLREQLRKTTTQMIERLAAIGDDRRAAFSVLVRQMAIASVTAISVLGILMALVVWLNSMAQREARQTTRTSRLLASTVDSALDAIIVSDFDGRIIRYNPSAEKIFGYTAAEVIGRDLSEFIVPQQHRAAHAAGMARMRASGEYRVVNAGRIQITALHRSGTEFPVEMQISSAEGEEGTIFIAFVRDISKRIAAEQGLMQARDKALAAERAKTEFMAVMSHEMRTPLNGVIAALEIARRKVSEPEGIRFIALAQDSASQLLRHANDVLDITRIESGGLKLADENFDLAEHLSRLVEAARPVCAEKGLTLDFAMLSESARLHGDPFRLGQIVQNFLSNAIKFVSVGGVTLEAELGEAGPGQRLIEVRVIDTGPGIAPEDQERIFDDFVMLDPSFRRSGHGAGLGLAIARRLARTMGGEVGVESIPGEGSCFWLRVVMPLAEGEVAPEPAAPSAETLPQLDVLVVEDNATNRLVLEEMLRHLGQKVQLAADGASGAAAAAAHRFDVILMDISMPVLDGLGATQLIRSGGASRHSRIVAVTAHSLPADIERFRAAGMDEVLAKPISGAALAHLLAGQPSPVETSAHALLDAARIEDLRGALGAAGMARLAKSFLRDGRAQADRVLTAVATGAPDADLARLCHEAAGVAAVFGAGQLRTLYAEAEIAAGKGQSAPARDTLRQNTLSLWAATEAAVRSLLTPASEGKDQNAQGARHHPILRIDGRNRDKIPKFFVIGSCRQTPGRACKPSAPTAMPGPISSAIRPRRQK